MVSPEFTQLRTDSVWLPFHSHLRFFAFLTSSIFNVDVGKAGKHLSQGAEIGRQHKSHALREYEILIGDPRAVHWVGTHGVPNPQNFAARHVEVGVDGHGYHIFITQVNHNGGIHPARASSGASGMCDFCSMPSENLELISILS